MPLKTQYQTTLKINIPLSLDAQNGRVHPAAASDIDFKKRAIGGSACNAWFK
jgi:hypothetical protein